LAALRNPGKIFIEKHNEEEAHFVRSIHEAIIYEELFDKVQGLMDRRISKTRPNVKILCDENLPLRGFLTCPECGRIRNGSAFKGRANRYYYYHCKAPCTYRCKAEVVNDKFLEIFKRAEMKESVKNYLRKLLIENFKDINENPIHRRKKIVRNLKVTKQAQTCKK
jgi:hypothetical protein